MKLPLIENLRIESLSCFKHQAKTADCVIVQCKFLLLENNPLSELIIDSSV